jgi:hypothetical protein
MRAPIPQKDLKEFLSLPPHIRVEVETWINRLLALDGAKPLLPAVLTLCERQKLNTSTIYRKLSHYRHYGWRGLINRAKFPSNLPPTSNDAFLRFVHGLWLANNKNYRNTHLQLLAIWKQKAPIPGYGEHPTKSHWNDSPDGWTYENIIYHIKTFIKNHPEINAAV